MLIEFVNFAPYLKGIKSLRSFVSDVQPIGSRSNTRAIGDFKFRARDIGQINAAVVNRTNRKRFCNNLATARTNAIRKIPVDIGNRLRFIIRGAGFFARNVQDNRTAIFRINNRCHI